MLISWNRGNAPQHVAQHFSLKEFECKCGKCEKQMIDTLLLERLDSLRVKTGGPIMIHSGYRCPKHNAAVGGEKKSKHMLGLAADISSEISMAELEKLCETEFNRLGIAKTFIHCDVADGKVKWFYP
jgi:uncharacterized protein YcbK (DUF882 family)